MKLPTSRYYQPRGSKNHLISSKGGTTGAASMISSLISASESDDDETLIDIKITNPLKRIYELMQEIKKHQATTFSLKFTVPLIALPLFLLAAFELGRDQAICQQLVTSKTGAIKNITVDIPQNTENNFPFVGSLLALMPFSHPTTEHVTEERAILIDPIGNATTILHPALIDLNKYNNSNVIVTGTYSSCTAVISVVAENNISIL